MAHNGRCSSSTGTRCQCSCRGVLHGGNGQQLVAGPWHGDVEFVHNGRRSRLRESVDGLVVSLCDRLFRATSASSGGRLSDDKLLDEAADLIADTIVELLEPNPRKRRKLRKRFQKDHTLCSFFVDMVRAMEAISSCLPDVVEREVAQIARLQTGPDRLPPAIAGKAAKVIVSKWQNAATGGVLPAYIKTCRYLAVVSCPDVGRHPAVAKHCAEPLAQEYLTNEVRDQLERFVENERPPEKVSVQA